jgi:TRAP-type C4-dicarboxylate transport system substrate-binding protein
MEAFFMGILASTRSLMMAAAVASTSLMVAAAAQAETWVMPTPYPDSQFHTVNILKFAEDVKAATNGELVIEVHAGGSLFKHPEIKNAVRSGQAQIGEFLLSNIANENAVFGIDSVPFLATDYDSALKLWQASKPVITEALDKQGLVPLYAVAWPPQGLYSSKPLTSADDLKGMKFRAYNPATSKIADLLGAVPTQIEVPDLAQAFATGRVEAMITSASTGVGAKAWDFVHHFYDVQAWLPKNVIVVNKRVWAKLSPETQAAVLKAAAAAEQRGWAMSRQERDDKNKILADNGVEVIAPSDTLMAGLTSVGLQMVDEWKAAAGPDGDRILDAYRK